MDNSLSRRSLITIHYTTSLNFSLPCEPGNGVAPKTADILVANVSRVFGTSRNASVERARSVFRNKLVCVPKGLQRESVIVIVHFV
jgi:hypothetical protein